MVEPEAGAAAGLEADIAVLEADIDDLHDISDRKSSRAADAVGEAVVAVTSND